VGLRGKEEGGGVRSGPGENRTMIVLHIISAMSALGPVNSLLWYVPSSRYIWSSAPILFLQEQIRDIIIIVLATVPMLTEAHNKVRGRSA
jgi:hypothetical protein